MSPGSQKMAKDPKHPSLKHIPSVRIAQPAGRPLQIRYTCPVLNREVRISVGSRNTKEAEELKSEIEAKLRLGIAVQGTKKKMRGPEMEWAYFREEYRSLHLNTLRTKSIQNAESRLDIAERILRPLVLSDMASTSSLQQIQARLLAGEFSKNNRPRSPHTVRGYMKAIIAALNWAYLQDWLTMPPKIPRLKVSKRKVMKGRPISSDEFNSMLNATILVVGEIAAPSWKLVLRGLWESALRLDELMHLSWNLPGTIRPAWTNGKHAILDIPASMQKNDTDESIPLLPGFEGLLKEMMVDANQGWIFNPISLQTKHGKKVRYERPDAEWVGKVIAKIGQKAGVVVEPGDESRGLKTKYASAHDLRRSCGDRLRNAGVPPLVICRIMRHSSWDTTRRHYAPGDVQADAATLRQTLDQDDLKKST